MSRPLFSCVIPVKGDRPFFKDALASLESQGMGEELEVIVQDGGEGSGGVGGLVSGGVGELVSGGVEGELVSGGVESGGVRWFREKDVGQSDALNKGFGKANGEWLFWLSADDVLLPGVLIKVKRLLHSSTPPLTTLNWLAGDTVYIDEQGKVKDVRCDAKWRSWFGKKLSVWTGGPSAFFTRELWEKRGGFDAELKYVMDIDLWTRWAKAGEKFVGLGDYVWGFRVHGGSRTMNGENSAAQIAECRAIEAKYGVSSGGFWRNVTRIASVLDGSWSKRKRDSECLHGKMFNDLGMRILHVVPGLDEVGNGISVAARLIANEQGADLVEARRFASGKCDASQYDEVWVHSAWLPMVLRSCRRVLKLGKRLVRMAHANYDPVRLRYHGWKKRIVAPVDRYYLRKAVKVIATGEAEKGWIEAYLGHRCPPIELTDIKRFFKLNGGFLTQRRRDAELSLGRCPRPPSAEGSPISFSAHSAPLRLCAKNNEQAEPLHLLYLGRRHPLKGVEYLETAVRQIQDSSAHSAPLRLCVKIVSSAFGDELEKVWDWCDVLVLPTLSENFGLVIAEALEHGKSVITTDGAPAWECECKVESEKCKVASAGAIWQGYDGRLIYLKGYRDGSDEQRVELLKSAIERICG